MSTEAAEIQRNFEFHFSSKWKKKVLMSAYEWNTGICEY